jgi:hypothetical protein
MVIMKNVIKVYLACGVIISAIETILTIKDGLYYRLNRGSGTTITLLSGVFATLIWVVAGPVHMVTKIIKK